MIQPAPLGNVMLHVDGSTALRPGAWASLEFELVAIPGRDNTTGRPIYLLPLDVPNGLQVSETVGGTITLLEIPGFSLIVEPGSATFPGGGQSGVVSVTAVHADKVPNFGQQPRLVVTIQPPGVIFDPPAQVTYPNLDGLAPGEITEFYSFDHDMGTFVAIGTGSVSEDGTVIQSDPGVGILKGGWQCAGNPQPTGQCQNVFVNVSPPQLSLFIGETKQFSATGRPQPIGNPAYSWTLDSQGFVDLNFADGNDSQTHPSNTVELEAIQETDDPQSLAVVFMTSPQQGNPPEMASASGRYETKCPLESVEWEQKDPDQLDANPNTGEGLRVFPEKRSPSDQTDRSVVNVKATINPANEGVSIFFKAFDLDDPSTDESPVDNNGALGGDNRGGAGMLTPTQATTTTLAPGEVSVEFKVPMNPGDNFRARISILALARPQYTPALPRIPSLFALHPAHHLRR